MFLNGKLIMMIGSRTPHSLQMEIFGVSIFESRLQTAKCLVSLGELLSLEESTVVIDT